VSKSQIARLVGMVCAGLMIGHNQALGFSSGPPAGFTGSPASGGADCTQCHSGVINSGPGSVQVQGLPSAYTPNAIYNLIVRIEDAGRVGAGFQLSAEGPAGTHIGTLAPADANAQSELGFVHQTTTGYGNSLTNWSGLGDAAEFAINWQAPAGDEGPVTFWAVGNAVDDSGTNSGDNVYAATASVSAGAGIPTVGEWGLALFVILLLTAGTILAGRGAPSPVHVRTR